MKITDIEVIPLEWGGRRPAAIRVATDEGLVGISRGSAAMAEAIEKHLKPLLIGEDPRDTDRLWWRMYGETSPWGVDRRALVAIIGAIDIALWDILGKSMGLPIYRLLGGHSNRTAAYADQIEFPVGEDYGQQLAEIEESLKEGFWAVKIHLLREDVEEAVKKARESRELMGPEAIFGIDLWRRWPPEEAARAAKAFEALNVAWLEEPMSWDDPVGGTAYVASMTSIPIAAGEGDCTMAVWRDMLARGGVKIVQPDIITGGGITQLRRVADVAEAYHGRLMPHGASYPEIIAHLMAGLHNGYLVTCTPRFKPTQLWSRLYKEPIEVKEGWITLSDKPGLGLELDEGFIAKHRA